MVYLVARVYCKTLISNCIKAFAKIQIICRLNSRSNCLWTCTTLLNLHKAMETVIEQSKQTALNQHSRRLSQFACISNDVSRIVKDNPIKVTQISKQAMRDIDPKFESTMVNELFNEAIIQDSFDNHSRKRSQFDSVYSKMSLYFDDDNQAKKMAQNIMKEQFVKQQKQQSTNNNNNNSNNNNNNNNVNMNVHGPTNTPVGIIGPGAMGMTMATTTTTNHGPFEIIHNTADLDQERINYLECQLVWAKNEMQKQNEIIIKLKQENSHLKKLKRDLALKANQTIDEMRSMIRKISKKYQKK